MSEKRSRRRVALRGWNTGFKWTRSGTKSKAMDMPFEIYEERYEPDLLVVGSINGKIVRKLFSDIREITRSPRLNDSDLIYIMATAVVGKNLDTLAKARRAGRSDTSKKATVRTSRLQIRELGVLSTLLREKLDHLAELASKPSWLVSIQVTFYLDEDDAERRVKIAGIVEMYD